jgi:hypothetical protein
MTHSIVASPPAIVLRARGKRFDSGQSGDFEGSFTQVRRDQASSDLLRREKPLKNRTLKNRTA